MFPSIDPRKMQSMLKQLGMQQEEVIAKRVVIETAEKNIIIENPSVSKINMRGEESWQISGEAREETADEIKKEDVKTVMEKTGKSETEAIEALKNADGDLAEAILNLG